MFVQLPKPSSSIARTLPKNPGQRNHRVFDFVRELKALASLADAPGRQLKPYVQRWPAAARPFIQPPPSQETGTDFRRARGRGRAARPGSRERGWQGRHGARVRACPVAPLPA